MTTSIISQNVEHIKQIPQLKQVQYDVSSQLYYVNKALLALGYEGISTNPALYTPDNQIEQLLPTLTARQVESSLDENQKKYFKYMVANRLGLYDAADCLRFW